MSKEDGKGEPGKADATEPPPTGNTLYPVSKNLDDLAGWPEKVDGYKDLAFFLFFFCLYLLILMMQINPTQSYAVNSALRQLVDGNGDVKTTDDFIEYFEQLLPKIFVTEWYNGDTLSPDEAGYIMLYNKLVGGLLIVQKKGTDTDCPDGLYKTFYGKCHSDELDTGTTEPKPEPHANTTFEYSDEAGGHSAFFSVSNSLPQVQAQWEGLKDALWLDKNTRTVQIKMATYNGEYEMFSFVILQFRFVQGGVTGGKNNVIIASARLELYKTTEDWVRCGLELLFVYMVAWILVEEMIDVVLTIKESGPKGYFASGWNYFDLGNLALVILYIILRCLYLGYVFLHPIKLPSNKYQIELEEGADMLTALMLIIIVNIFIKILHLFKYFAFQGRMNILNTTMGIAAEDLIHFFLLFGLIFLAYTAMAMLLFGPHLMEYSTFGLAAQTMGEHMLGNSDFDGMHAINPLMATLMLWSYILLVSLTLVNVFLAILIDSYAEAKAESAGAFGIPEDIAQWIRIFRAGGRQKLEDQKTVLLQETPMIKALTFFHARGIEHINSEDIIWYMKNELHLAPEAVAKQLNVMTGMTGGMPEAESDIQVTLNEMLKSAWVAYDEDNSGSLSHDEFRKFMLEAPIKVDPDTIEETRIRTDRNNDGSISFEEFTPVFHAVMLQMLNEQAERLKQEQIRKQRALREAGM